MGLVLIVAGGLKLHAFATGDRSEDWSSTFLALLAESEIGMGLWLAWEARVGRTRPWAIAIFSGFWAANLQRVLAGGCSCGCFGVVAISPWSALTFDTVALVLLLGRRPADAGGRPEDEPGLATYAGAVLVAIVVVVAATQQRALVIVSGQALRAGRPLADAQIIVRGDQIETEVRTDERGRFRLPPMQAGLYSVRTAAETTTTSPTPRGPSPARRPGTVAPPGPSEQSKRYAERDVAPLRVGDCKRNIEINF